MIRLAVPALLLITACATTAATRDGGQDRATAQVQRTLAGLQPGAPQRCIQRGDVTSVETAPGVILYVAGRDRVWRNQVVGSCRGLARGDLLVSTDPSGRYCSGDLVQTRARIGGALTGSCSLGDFVPYTK